MVVVKRSISLDEELAMRIERAAEVDGVPFSTWLADAAERGLLRSEGLQGVREWEAEAGPLTPEERAAGRALLDKLMAEADALGDQ